jgi:phosphoesterase RecJ-like protein
MKKSPQKILNFINKYETFVVIGHIRPDGDCIASQRGLCTLLKKLNKECAAAYHIPEDAEIPDDPEDSRYKRYIENNTAEYYIKQGEAVIIVDCSELTRIGKFGEMIKDNPLGIIDHHAFSDSEAEAEYINPDFPAAALMVKRVYDELGIIPDQDTAEELFHGFCTDTGFFQFLESNSGDYIHDAADLVNCGASPKKTYKNIYSGKKLDSRKYIAEVLSRMQTFAEDKLIILTETEDQPYKESSSSTEIYNLLLTSSETEVIAFIKYAQEDDSLVVSLRSKEKVNVGQIAAEFGGGGHALASGFKTDLKMKELKNRLIEKLSAEINREKLL